MPPRRRRHQQRRAHRKLLIWIASGLAVALLLPVVVMVVLVLTINPDTYKTQLESFLRDVLGRDLHIRGHLSVSASLTPTLEADDVTLPNMPGGSRGDMMRIEHITVELATRALLTGQFAAARVTLIRPDILLETDAAGNANWRYRATPAPATAGPPAHLSLLTMHLHDGRITWRNGATGETIAIDLRRLSLTAGSLNSPVVINAEMLYGRQRIGVTGQTGPWARFIDSTARTPWALFVTLDNQGAKLTVTGTLTRPSELRGYSLQATVAAPDLGTLGWLSPWPLPALHNFAASARLLEAGDGYPDISNLLVQAGYSSFDKVTPSLSLDSVRIDMARLSDPVAISVEGTFASAPLRLSGTLGAPALLLPGAPTGQGYNVDISAEAAGASFAARGAIAEPALGKGMDIAVGARIPDLATLAPLLRLRLPMLRSIAFAGQLTDGQGGFRTETALRNIVLTLPQGDLSGEIALALEARPRLRAVVKAGRIDADALRASWEASKPGGDAASRGAGGFGRRTDITAPPPLPSLGTTLIPDDRLPLASLRTVDMDVRANIGQLRAGAVTYRGVETSVVLSDGRLVVNPLSGELGGGTAELRVAVDARQPAAAVTMTLKAQGVDTKGLLTAWDVPTLVTGKLDLGAELQSVGGSWHELAAGLNGRLAASLSEGEFDARLATGMVAEILLAMRSGRERVEPLAFPLRCVALGLDIAGGNVSLSRLGFDAQRLFGSAGGQVNLGAETTGVQLRSNLRVAQPGQGPLAVPVKIENGWRDPKISPDPVPPGRAVPVESCAR